MGDFKTEILWVFACVGVIYLAIDIFGEGEAAACVAAVTAFVLTCMMITDNKK